MIPDARRPDPIHPAGAPRRRTAAPADAASVRALVAAGVTESTAAGLPQWKADELLMLLAGAVADAAKAHSR